MSQIYCMNMGNYVSRRCANCRTQRDVEPKLPPPVIDFTKPGKGNDK